MSKKENKALNRLDAALQELTPPEDPMDTYEKELAQKSKYKIYNTDCTDTDPETYSDALFKPRRRFPVLLLLVLAVLAGLLWYLWQQGVIPW